MRRFPPPWTVEEQEAFFVVRDHNGQQLAYVYFEDEPGRRSAAKLLRLMRPGGLRSVHLWASLLGTFWLYGKTPRKIGVATSMKSACSERVMLRKEHQLGGGFDETRRPLSSGFDH
jgi:hypothetical protein